MPKATEKTTRTAEAGQGKVQLIKPWTVQEVNEHWAALPAQEQYSRKLKSVKTKQVQSKDQEMSTSDKDEIVEVIPAGSIDSTCPHLHPQYTHGHANDMLQCHK